MSIKMIAVDMDGTFLKSDSTYDKERFDKVYQEIKKRKIHFVVASGNPYKQLQNTFSDIQDELIYVAENGGYIVVEGNEMHLSHLEDKDANKIIEMLKTLPDVLSWVCSKDQSYTLKSLSNHYYEMFLPYFPGVKRISDYTLIKDPIIKFALYLPNGNVEERIADFIHIVSQDVSVIDSGHSCVDLIPSHTNKGTAIELLMDRYGLQPDEIIAFGDAGNDEAMLKKVKYGYVMDNAKDDYKSKFDYMAPSNDEQGVLAVLENYFVHDTFINLK